MSWFQALLMADRGTIYYVSSGGTGNGLRMSTPMSVTSFASVSLQQFDKVYFNRGDSFNLTKYNITADDVTIGAYGSGADPIIYGSTSYTSATWTSESGGYYSTPLATAPKWVFKNGIEARQGESAWIPMTANTTGTTMTALAATLNAFNSVESLVGVKIRHKEFAFRLSYGHTATGYNTGTGVITIGAGGVVGGASGMPLKLYGQKQFSTLEGDWWYDDTNDKLWIKTVATPSGTNIRVCTEDSAFFVTGDRCTITGLEFTQYYRAAVETTTANNLTLNNYVHDIRTNGYWLSLNSSGYDISGEIERCGLNGICMGAISDSSLHDLEIHEISDVTTQGNIGWPIDGAWLKTGGCAVACNFQTGETDPLPDTITCTNLNFYNLGYCGLLMIGRNWTVTNSVIHDFCKSWVDGGGLYSVYQTAFGTGGSGNNLYEDCIVYNGIGNYAGIVGPDQSIAAGVYMDNGCNNIEVRNVTVYSCMFAGIFTNNNSEELKLYDCFLYNNGVGSIQSGANVVFHEAPDVTNDPNFLNNYKNVMEGCIIISDSSTQVYAVLSVSNGPSANASYNPFVSGNCDNNIYISQYKFDLNNYLFKHSVLMFSSHTTIAFAAWKTRISDDAASVLKGFYLDYTAPTLPIEDLYFYPNNTASPVFHDLTDGLYEDAAGSTVNDITSPAFGASYALMKASWFYLMDGFINTNGTSMSGKAPTVGNNAVQVSGAHTTSTSNNFTMVSSSAGLVSWNTGVADNYAFEIIATVTNTSSIMRMDCRLADDSGSANNRIILDFTGGNIRLREFYSSATATQTLTTAFTLAVAPTFYRIRIEVRGAQIKVYVKTDAGADTLYHTMTTSLLTGTRVGIFGETTRRTDFVTVYPIT